MQFQPTVRWFYTFSTHCALDSNLVPYQRRLFCDFLWQRLTRMSDGHIHTHFHARFLSHLLPRIISEIFSLSQIPSANPSVQQPFCLSCHRAVYPHAVFTSGIRPLHHFSDMYCLFSAFLSLWQLPFPRCLSNYHLSALLWKLVCLALKTCLSFSETRYLPHDVRAVITFLSLMGCLFSSGQSIQIMFLYSLSPVHFLPICQVKFIRFTRFVYSAPFVPHHMSYLCHLSSAKSIHSVSVSHHFCIFLTFAPIVQKGQIAYKPVAI